MHFYKQNTQCYEYIYIYSEYLKRQGLDIITEELFLSCYIFAFYLCIPLELKISGEINHQHFLTTPSGSVNLLEIYQMILTGKK